MHYYARLALGLPIFLSGSMLAADTAMSYNVALGYYVASILALGSVISAAILVLKFWAWIRGQWSRDFAAKHNALEDKIDSIVTAIRSLPCLECEHHARPATLVSLPPPREKEEHP